MNEPIISPWVFYFIGMTTPLIAISFISLALFILFFFFLLSEIENARDSEKKGLYMALKITSFLIFLSLTLFILIPTESTCYKMLVAQNLTKQNIVNTSETINNALDKAVDKIIKIQSEGKKK